MNVNLAALLAVFAFAGVMLAIYALLATTTFLT